jgi:CBS domain containing-hemolysin-like protein
MMGGPEPPPPGRDGTRPHPWQALRRWLRHLRHPGNGEATVRETLEELFVEREEAQTPIRPDEKTLIANVLAVRDRTVRDVMVPRADIVAVEEKTPLADLMSLMGRVNHSRIPVFRETLDDIVGMVHIKDVVDFEGRRDAADPVPLAGLMRTVLFVAPSLRVLDLLLRMRGSRTHMALVVDEYGGIDGLVTIEDLVEEIVGEIEDEHDKAQLPHLVRLPDGSFEADARATLEEVEKRFGAKLVDKEQEDEIDTLGGLVFTLIGRVPSRGELIRHPSGLEFEVIEADPRRIRRLRVRQVEPARRREK